MKPKPKPNRKRKPKKPQPRRDLDAVYYARELIEALGCFNSQRQIRPGQHWVAHRSGHLARVSKVQRRAQGVTVYYQFLVQLVGAFPAYGSYREASAAVFREHFGRA